MEITEKVRDYILEELKNNKLDALRIYLTEENEEYEIHMELLTKDEIKEIPVKDFGSLKVAITKEDEDALEDVIFDFDENGIAIILPEHHHDGECCCGHHDDEGCCDHEHHCCCEEEK